MGLNLSQGRVAPRHRQDVAGAITGGAADAAPWGGWGALIGDVYAPQVTARDRPAPAAAQAGALPVTTTASQAPAAQAGALPATTTASQAPPAQAAPPPARGPQPPPGPPQINRQPQSQDVLTGYSRMGSFFEPRPLNNRGVPNTGGGFGSVPSGG